MPYFWCLHSRGIGHSDEPKMKKKERFPCRSTKASIQIEKTVHWILGDGRSPIPKIYMQRKVAGFPSVVHCSSLCWYFATVRSWSCNTDTSWVYRICIVIDTYDSSQSGKRGGTSCKLGKVGCIYRKYSVLPTSRWVWKGRKPLAEIVSQHILRICYCCVWRARFYHQRIWWRMMFWKSARFSSI